jgi:uncharacterized membrane protein
MRLDPAIGSLLILNLAALFGFAAFHKMKAPREFEEAFRAYRIVPGRAAHAISRVLGWLELATGLGLLIPFSRVLACLTAALILLTYACAIGINLVRGRRDLDCGCGPARDRRPIASWMLGRNGAIAAAALLATLPWSARTMGAVDLFTVLAGTAAFALLYASLDALLGRIAPRAAALRAR